MSVTTATSVTSVVKVRTPKLASGLSWNFEPNKAFPGLTEVQVVRDADGEVVDSVLAIVGSEETPARAIERAAANLFQHVTRVRLIAV